MIGGERRLRAGRTPRTLPWLAIPVVTLRARFTGRGVAAGIALSTGALPPRVAAAHAAAILDDPPC